MSGFTSQWLAAREPVDHAARNETVMAGLAHYLQNEGHVRITDLACGTGSTMRALMPFIQNEASWTLIDNDRDLLEIARDNAGDRMVTCLEADLSDNLESVFETTPNLITISAFLDLVSRAWLENFIAGLCGHGIAFYAALTYDGRKSCSPVHVADDALFEAFDNHQRCDKGFGSALGPDAADVAVNLLEDAGYTVLSDKSDWHAEAGSNPLFQHMLVDGWHQAACEISASNTSSWDEWLAFRKQSIDRNNHSLVVGHVDFLAVPPG